MLQDLKASQMATTDALTKKISGFGVRYKWMQSSEVKTHKIKWKGKFFWVDTTYKESIQMTKLSIGVHTRQEKRKLQYLENCVQLPDGKRERWPT